MASRLLLADGAVAVTIPPNPNNDKTEKTAEQRPEDQPQHTYAECIRLTRDGGRFHTVLLLGTAAGCLTVLLEDNCMSYVLPAARCALGLTVQQQGVLYVATTFGFVCASHVWGCVADTWGRQKVLRCALGLTAAASAVSACAWGAGTLLAARFAVGLCVAGVKGTAMSYVAEFHGAERRAQRLTLLSSLMWTAAVVQPLLAWFVFRVLGADGTIYGVAAWRVFVACCSAWATGAAIVMAWLPESPKFLLAVGRQREAIEVLTRMWRVNGGERRKEQNTTTHTSVRYSSHLQTGQFPVCSIVPLDVPGSAQTRIRIRTPADVGRVFWAQTRPLLVRPYRFDLLLCCVYAFAALFVCHAWLMWYPQLVAVYAQGDSDVGGDRSYDNATATMCTVLTKPMWVQQRDSDHSSYNGSDLAVAVAREPQPDEANKCESTLNETSLKASLMLGISMITINTIVALTVGFVRPKFLHGEWRERFRTTLADCDYLTNA